MIGLLLVHIYIWAHNLDVESVYCSWDPQSYDCIISTQSLRFSASFQSCDIEIPCIYIYVAAACCMAESDFTPNGEHQARYQVLHPLPGNLCYRAWMHITHWFMLWRLLNLYMYMCTCHLVDVIWWFSSSFGYPDELPGSHLRCPVLHLMRLFYFPNPSHDFIFSFVSWSHKENTLTHSLSFLHLLASNADGNELSKPKFIPLKDSLMGQTETPIYDFILALHWILIGTRY